MTTFNCMVTHPSYHRIGGGDPYMTTETVYPAHFNGRAVWAPRLGASSDGQPAIKWDCCFTVDGSPEMPFKRFMVSQGTRAAHIGGAPVQVRPLSDEELAAAERKIAGWLIESAA
jgi:hypothetical protein